MTPRTKILGRWPDMSRERAQAAVEAILAPIKLGNPKKGKVGLYVRGLRRGRLFSGEKTCLEVLYSYDNGTKDQVAP